MKKIFSLITVIKKMVPLLLLSVFLLPMAARAEIKAGSVELSPFVGYNFFQSRQNLKDRPVFFLGPQSQYFSNYPPVQL